MEVLMSNDLEALLENNVLLNQDIFSEINIEELLDNRDSEEFDQSWSQAFEEVEASKALKDIPDNSKVRRLAFDKVYEHGPGGELAEYVSDDFGLIYDAYELEYNNPWLNRLFQRYIEGEIPSGFLSPLNTPLKEMILNL